jgi:hypothetical protein
MGRRAVAITNNATSTMTAARINAQICHVFTADHAGAPSPQRRDIEMYTGSAAVRSPRADARPQPLPVPVESDPTVDGCSHGHGPRVI